MIAFEIALIVLLIFAALLGLFALGTEKSNK